MTKYDTSYIPNVNGVAQYIADNLLKKTDWTQLPDSGLTNDCVANFVTYRASVRTIRKTNPDIETVTWPTVPSEEWS
jgi:hypothetical protein